MKKLRDAAGILEEEENIGADYGDKDDKRTDSEFWDDMEDLYNN